MKDRRAQDSRHRLDFCPTMSHCRKKSKELQGAGFPDAHTFRRELSPPVTFLLSHQAPTPFSLPIFKTLSKGLSDSIEKSAVLLLSCAVPYFLKENLLILQVRDAFLY